MHVHRITNTVTWTDDPARTATDSAEFLQSPVRRFDSARRLKESVPVEVHVGTVGHFGDTTPCHCDAFPSVTTYRE